MIHVHSGQGRALYDFSLSKVEFVERGSVVKTVVDCHGATTRRGVADSRYVCGPHGGRDSKLDDGATK